MSSRVGLGVPLPNLLPVVGSFTAPFTAYLVVLTMRVSNCRVEHKKWLGQETGTAVIEKDGHDPLYLAARAHANFLENVPITLLLAGLAELNGANRKILTGVLSVYFALRVAHVELGLKVNNALGVGRPVGFFGSLATMAGLAGYNVYLSRGYWGF